LCSKQGSTQENKDAAIEDDSIQESWLKIPDGSHQNADGFYSVCCDNFTPRVLQKPKLTTK
jgi:hypothetical protein